MNDMEWYCSKCQKIKKLDGEPETERQLFEDYQDDFAHKSKPPS